MRILLIRHGDPDYENDALTEAGRKEAEALSERMKSIKKTITDYYLQIYPEYFSAEYEPSCPLDFLLHVQHL